MSEDFISFGCGKHGNDYARQLGSLYMDVPKSVLAAIAVSALTTGGDYIEHAKSRLAREWQVLYDNGIVPQKPSKIAREAVYEGDYHE